MPSRPESEEPQGPIEFDFIDGAVVRRASKQPSKTGPAAPTPKVQSTVEPSVPRNLRPAEAPSPAQVPSQPQPAPAPAASPSSAPAPVSASTPRAEAKPDPAPPLVRPVERVTPAPQTSPIPERPMPTPTPHTIDDFRRNAERQSKEQKTFGNVLATITYSILIAFILVTGLAGYGGYILLKRIQTQETSLAELDRRYEGELVAVKEDLKRTTGLVQQLQGDLGRQQEQIGRLGALAAKSNADLASARKDIAALQSQVSQLRSTTAGGR